MSNFECYGIYIGLMIWPEEKDFFKGGLGSSTVTWKLYEYAKNMTNRLKLNFKRL